MIGFRLSLICYCCSLHWLSVLFHDSCEHLTWCQGGSNFESRRSWKLHSVAEARSGDDQLPLHPRTCLAAAALDSHPEEPTARSVARNWLGWDGNGWADLAAHHQPNGWISRGVHDWLPPRSFASCISARVPTISVDKPATFSSRNSGY